MKILRLINWLVDVGGFYDMCVEGVGNHQLDKLDTVIHVNSFGVVSHS